MPHKQKISAEAKVSLIRRYKAGEISLAEAGRQVQSQKQKTTFCLQLKKDSDGIADETLFLFVGRTKR